MSVPAAEPLLRLRPVGLGEILDDVFRVYRRHFGLLCAIALLLSLPAYVLGLTSGSADQLGFLAGLMGNLGSLGNPATMAALGQPPAVRLWLVGLQYLLVVALLPFTLGAITWTAVALAVGQPVSVRSAFAGVARRYWALLALALLEVLAVAVVGGLAALIGVVVQLVAAPPVLVTVALVFLLLLGGLVLLLFLAIRFVVAVPALLAEGAGPFRALGRSWGLTRGNWWRLLGTLFVVYLLVTAVQTALGAVALPLAILIPFIPAFVRGAIILTLSTASQVVAVPVLYLCLALLYFDLRVRREDFDLDQLARQAAAPPA